MTNEYDRIILLCNGQQRIQVIMSARDSWWLRCNILHSYLLLCIFTFLRVLQQYFALNTVVYSAQTSIRIYTRNGSLKGSLEI